MMLCTSKNDAATKKNSRRLGFGYYIVIIELPQFGVKVLSSSSNDFLFKTPTTPQWNQYFRTCRSTTTGSKEDKMFQGPFQEARFRSMILIDAGIDTYRAESDKTPHDSGFFIENQRLCRNLICKIITAFELMIFRF